MKPAPEHPEEGRRLEALRELAILDTLDEAEYDDLTFLAASICRTPIALVSLIDADRQWFKSRHGLEAHQTPRRLAYCAHTILGDGPLIVPDALADERFADNPLATGPPYVRFYAGVPIRHPAGLPMGTLCVIDHAPRQPSAGEMRSLAALGRQLEALLELRLRLRALDEAARQKDEFIAMINHELRTPLTSVHGAIRLLAAGDLVDLEGKVGSLLDLARRNSDRLLTIVSDILDIAALESGRFTLRRVEFDLTPLVRRIVDATLAGEERPIEVVDAGAPTPVTGDEQRLGQVVQNLLGNALKYGAPGTPITVEIGSIDGAVRVRVTNRGPGIDARTADRLFEKFFRGAHDGDPGRPGTGLGLAICRALVESHGGTIGFESTPEEETTFFFELPAAS